MISGGYWGKLLRVNLTTKESSIENIPEQLLLSYLGGAGLGIKYLFDEVDPQIDALCEGNPLIFVNGPLTGTDAPCASRMSVVSKSPLTQAVGMCMTGGYFPVELKSCGIDMLIIEGKSVQPVYLWIKNGEVHFREASKIWGSTTFDCQQIIKDDLNDQNIRIACIGPAGENLSLIANIINERRAAGRKGLGAVMGSKKLKAIAVRGNQEVSIADSAAFKEARQAMLKAMKESPVLYSKFSKHGTPPTVDTLGELGIFPTKNYMTTGSWAPVADLGLEGNEIRRVGNEHCYKCPVGCSQIKLVRQGKHYGKMSSPEFETIYSFGGATGVTDMDAVIAADRICDEQGVDTISAGITIAFVMELYEKGILTSEETDGLDLRFGNSEAMLDLLLKMCSREGFGDVIGDGSLLAAQRIGKNTEKFTLTIKGLELPGYDVRGAKAHGLQMATAYTGADHNRGYAFQEIFGIPIPWAVDRFSLEGKAELTKWNQDMRTTTCDCATMCAFLMDMAVPAIAAQNTASLVSGASGLKFSVEDIPIIGERIINVARLFNIGCGKTRADDTLPERLQKEPIPDGPSKGHAFPREDLELLLDEYYEVRGWSKDGVPSAEKLYELGISVPNWY